eukprot:GHVS01052306.1.p1 GENE.GHVS01052306.1~~GHVS01052306.1.p1  ORF type:complete len:278 (+),score=7.11 GHVS01052306.1:165-998(+)
MEGGSICRSLKETRCCFLPLLWLPIRVAFVMLLDTMATSIKLIYWIHYNFFFIEVDTLINLVLVFDVSRALTAAICVSRISRFYFGASSPYFSAAHPRRLLLCYFFQYIAMQLWDYIWAVVQLFSPNFCQVTLETPLLELLLRHLVYPAQNATSNVWHQFFLSASSCSHLRITLFVLLAVSLFCGIYFDIIIWTLTSYDTISEQYDNRSEQLAGRLERVSGTYRSGFPRRTPTTTTELSYIPPRAHSSDKKSFDREGSLYSFASSTTIDSTPKSVCH